MSNPIDIESRNLSADEQLRAIDSVARSSSRTIGGNIGLIDGHVVKFNTHWQERLFSKTTDEMRAASDAMRVTLKRIIGDIFGEDKAMVDKLGKMIDGKGLLERAVVAKVVDAVVAAGKDWVKSSESAIQANRSTDQNTEFATVSARAKESAAERKVEHQKFVDEAMPFLRAHVDRMKGYDDPYGMIKMPDEDELKKLLVPRLTHLFRNGFKISQLRPGGSQEFHLDLHALFVLNRIKERKS